MLRLLLLLVLALAVAYVVPAPARHFETQIEIAASREKVWDVMADLDQLSRWNEDVDSTVYATAQHGGVGTEIHIDGSFYQSTMRITGWQPYNSIDFAVELKPRLTENHVLRYTIQRRYESSTLVNAVEEYQVRGGYLGHLFGLLLFDRMRDPYRGEALGYLKRLAETGVGIGN